MALSNIFSVLSRKKSGSREDVESSREHLARVLTVLDLTLLSIGSTLGVGSYVVPGKVARNEAGPAVTISFFFATIISVLAALCYAEFAARVPKAGSAYVYSYTTVGEFCAFVIGWALISEYVIGTASVAKGLVGHVDTLFNKTYGNYMNETVPMRWGEDFAAYPDVVSFLLILLLSVVIAWGVKESSTLNNILTAVNLITISIILVVGAIKANPSNWTIPKDSLPPPTDKVQPKDGGFMPFGFLGVIKGATTCFYSFIGFDCIATSGEEAKNPQKTIPRAIVLSLMIIFCVYFSISTVLTMMVPYYDQDLEAPFIHAFDVVGMPKIKWLISVGAVSALIASLLGAIFPMARIVMAMAKDGLLFKFLAKINDSTSTPVRATFVSGILAGLISVIFNMDQLIDMMSIGTLLAYSIVSLCILILRYRKYESDNHTQSELRPVMNGTQPKKEIDGYISRVLNLHNERRATEFSEAVSKILLTSFCILCFINAAVLFAWKRTYNTKTETNAFSIVPYFIAFGVLIGINIILLWRQPQANTRNLNFQVPLTPLVPTLSIYLNTCLMSQLDTSTWGRLLIWLILGLIMYAFYGVSHSKLGRAKREPKTEMKMTNGAHLGLLHSNERSEDGL